MDIYIIFYIFYREEQLNIFAHNTYISELFSAKVATYETCYVKQYQGDTFSGQ